jgi:hypothetical protein
MCAAHISSWKRTRCQCPLAASKISRGVTLLVSSFDSVSNDPRRAVTAAVLLGVAAQSEPPPRPAEASCAKISLSTICASSRCCAASSVSSAT